MREMDAQVTNVEAERKMQYIRTEAQVEVAVVHRQLDGVKEQ